MIVDRRAPCMGLVGEILLHYFSIIPFYTKSGWHVVCMACPQWLCVKCSSLYLCSYSIAGCALNIKFRQTAKYLCYHGWRIISSGLLREQLKLLGLFMDALYLCHWLLSFNGQMHIEGRFAWIHLFNMAVSKHLASYHSWMSTKGRAGLCPIHIRLREDPK